MRIAKKVLSVFLAMLMVFGTFAVGGTGLALTASADASVPFSGSGTQNEPYRIGSDADWQALAQYVADGGETAGKYFRQTANVAATVSVGSSEHPFEGKYNGYGKTLTASLSSDDQCCAPFSYIRGAAIRYLRVTGTVNGGIHCSGLVGSISGTGNRIYDCIVETSITTSGTHCGGFVGHGSTSETEIEGCVFSGSISGGTHVGVLWGWSDSGANVSIDNCLENGKAYSVQNLNPVALGNASSMVFGLIECVTPQIGSPNRNWTGAGSQVYAIRAGKRVSLDFGAANDVYNASGLNVYDSALMVCGDDAFAPAGKSIALTMTCASQNPGSSAAVFSASVGTLADGVLTMPAQDVTINVSYTYLGKTIEFGTEAIDVGCNTANAATVYYGGNPWRVIGFDGEGVACKAGEITLLASGSMGQCMFNQNGTNNQYSNSGCTLKSSVSNIFYPFSTMENVALERRTLAAGAFDGNNTDCIAGSDTYTTLWPLSTKEANALDSSLRVYGSASGWWLRSPGNPQNINFAAAVDKNGNVNADGVHIRSTLDVRPAFYVDLNKIVFLSAAAGGKQGDGVLTAIEDCTGSAWKLTLRDNSRFFGVTETAVTASVGGTARLTYRGAQTGENEYISVIVTDTDGAPRYYGRFVQPADASGTVEIPVPAYFAEGTYTLKVFNEQNNGDYKTDVASRFADVTLTVTRGNGKALQLVKNGFPANLKGAQESNVWFGNYM